MITLSVVKVAELISFPICILFVVSVISDLSFGDRILVQIVQVPCHCLSFRFAL